MSNLTESRALELEIEHNVYIDIETEQYNLAGHDETYGWLPIPEDWLLSNKGGLN